MHPAPQQLLKNFDVVLVEDDENDAELTLRVFQRTNLVNSALHFRTAEVAFEYLTDVATQPKVVLVDLGLRGMSGIDLLKSLKSHAKTKNIRTVVLTGGLPESVEEQNALDETHILLKPLDHAKLSRLMAEH